VTSKLPEVVELASRSKGDPEMVRRRDERALRFGPGMPAAAALWAEIADELDLVAALARHVDRIPANSAERVCVEPGPFEIPVSSPETGDWQPLTKKLLEGLIPGISAT
jgi:hypothetical protein